MRIPFFFLYSRHRHSHLYFARTSGTLPGTPDGAHRPSPSRQVIWRKVISPREVEVTAVIKNPTNPCDISVKDLENMARSINHHRVAPVCGARSPLTGDKSQLVL
ncbi:hypothetical protein EVAR_86614_1 [Eumeta japonica]|uniref:Uncharacterized protein n=1 Tax=Eumeta variegata TaxID=151549 RepID=A0A4C1W2T8_EUMVA|nr:hypothetical protein EVAR_86614_1 [Eumeta japonica]